MSQTAKTIIGVIIVILVAGGLIALNKNSNKNGGTTSGDAVTAGATYKIGVMLSLTGDASSLGEPARNVYQIATDEINNAGGVDGKKLELIVEDSKCNGKDATDAAQKLINVDKVQVIIGGFCSSESLSAVAVAESAKVALFSAGSSSPDLTGKSKFFFRNYPSDASQGSVLAEVAYNKQNMKKVAFLQEQQDYPLGIYKAFTAKFQGLGGTVTKEEFPKDGTDFRSQLTKLRSQNPDALFIDTQSPAGTQRVLKQLQDLQWKPKIFLTDTSLSDTKTLSDNKVILEGAFGAEFGANPNNPKMVALLASYKAKYNVDLPFQSYGQTEYDAVYIVKDAIMAVGYDGTKIADWGHKVSGWQGASGSITIGSDGDLIGGHTPKIVKDGKEVDYQ